MIVIQKKISNALTILQNERLYHTGCDITLEKRLSFENSKR